MEQIYLLEIFVDQVEVVRRTKQQGQNRLTITLKFGPMFELLLKEGEFVGSKNSPNVTNSDTSAAMSSSPKAPTSVKVSALKSPKSPSNSSPPTPKQVSVKTSEVSNEDVEGKDNETKNKGKTDTVTFRAGKSFLFPSYPDTLLQSFDKFPLEFTIWNNDEYDRKIFLGLGRMQWDTPFYDMVKKMNYLCNCLEPVTIKEALPLKDECCCEVVGEIILIVRLSAFGKNIITSFQQTPDDKENVIFKTDKTKEIYKCFKFGESKEPCMNFTNVGTIYQTTCLMDPETQLANDRQNRICMQMQDCGIDERNLLYVCGDDMKYTYNKKYNKTIKMGDIVGPCGNTDCTLAKKIKNYLRTTDVYKKQATCQHNTNAKELASSIQCGQCDCHDDYETETDVDESSPSSQGHMLICQGCGGISLTGVTCNDDKHTTVSYMVATVDVGFPSNKKKEGIENCICQPPDDKPDCGAVDCVCKQEHRTAESRKLHKSYCPAFKHKYNCPVTRMQADVMEEQMEEEQKLLNDFSRMSLEEEPGPRGLPEIKLEPCPVLGRPCSVPDGLAKLYKPVKHTQPPSYSNAGKICCSKEFDRIKNFLTSYMKAETYEEICCDNMDTNGPQDLQGKSCCGQHKMSRFNKSKK